MDGTAVATSWGIFGVAAVVGCYYYWPRDQRRPDRHREDAQHAKRKGRNEQESRGRSNKRPTPEPNADNALAESTSALHSGNEVPRKRKVPTKEVSQTQAAPTVVVHADEPEESNMSTKHFAEQMLQTRRGADLTSTKSKDSRVKTVKQSSAVNTPDLLDGTEADDYMSANAEPSSNSGDVSDMLEPVAAGPSTLRVTAASKPQKEKTTRQLREEVVETKKQRQNRQKVEERRSEREAEEKERKVLEDKQRRAAREARGEPAKNGMQSSKPPASNAWADRVSTPVNDPTSTPLANGDHNAPLLDTFDVESNSSSNGYQAASTTATSINSAGATQWADELPSEEDQMAQVMKQSENDSGWTTVSQPKKQKKKAVDPETTFTEPALSNKTNSTSSKPTTNGKPAGFQALDVQYEQRTDADPNDASNWDA